MTTPFAPSWQRPCSAALDALGSGVSTRMAWVWFAHLAQLNRDWRFVVCEWRRLVLEVDLSGCISDSSISALSVCPRLQRLHLSRRSMLRDAIAEAQHCPRLYEEDVSCCRNLSPAALTSMIKNCPHLCSVDLGSCLALDDELLVLLAQHCSLRSLDLSNCSKLSDAALQALAMHCVELI